MDKSYFITDIIEQDLIKHPDFEDKARNLYDGFKLLYDNSMGFMDNEVFNQAFSAACPHRTHQQALIGNIFGLLRYIADDKFEVDGRNEYAKECVKKMLDAYDKENGFPLPDRLPVI